VKELTIEPKLIDLGTQEIKKNENIIDYNDKHYKKVQKNLKTDSTDKFQS